MATLVGVPGAGFERFRPLVWPFLEKMAAGGRHRFTASELADEIKDRGMQLWLSIDGMDILAAGLTQVVIYPRHKACRWIGLAGRDHRTWLRQQYEVEEWAKANGCTEMQALVGQRGWIRLLGFLGYSEDHVLVSKAL